MFQLDVWSSLVLVQTKWHCSATSYTIQKSHINSMMHCTTGFRNYDKVYRRKRMQVTLLRQTRRLWQTNYHSVNPQNQSRISESLTHSPSDDVVMSRHEIIADVIHLTATQIQTELTIRSGDNYISINQSITIHLRIQEYWLTTLQAISCGSVV